MNKNEGAFTQLQVPSIEFVLLIPKSLPRFDDPNQIISNFLMKAPPVSKDYKVEKVYKYYFIVEGASRPRVDMSGGALVTFHPWETVSAAEKDVDNEKYTVLSDFCGIFELTSSEGTFANRVEVKVTNLFNEGGPEVQFAGYSTC